MFSPIRPCVLWQGGKNSAGYGYFYRVVNGRRVQVAAHRDAWEQVNGPIPEGHTIDHLCMVRLCIEPTHLEPVTRAENTRREMAARLQIDCCRKAGHPYIGDNVYYAPDGKRHCNACRRQRARDRYKAQKVGV